MSRRCGGAFNMFETCLFVVFPSHSTDDHVHCFTLSPDLLFLSIFVLFFFYATMHKHKFSPASFLLLVFLPVERMFSPVIWTGCLDCQRIRWIKCYWVIVLDTDNPTKLAYESFALVFAQTFHFSPTLASFRRKIEAFSPWESWTKQ